MAAETPGSVSYEWLKPLVARRNDGVRLGKAGRHRDALVAYQDAAQLARDLEPASEARAPELGRFTRAVQIDIAGAYQLLSLSDERFLDDEIETREEFISLYGTTQDPSIRRQVAASMTMLAQALQRSGRPDAASWVLDALIERVGGDGDPEIASEVTDARREKAWETTRARRRRLDRRALLLVVYVVGLASLVLEVATSHHAASVRAFGLACAWAGLIVLVVTLARTFRRLKAMYKRRGVARALQVEYPKTIAAFVAGAVAIVAAQFAVWL